MKLIRAGVVMVGAAAAVGGVFSSNIDPAHKYSWGENIGWTNWQHDAPGAGEGVIVTATHLGGFAWAENVGWINLGNGAGPYANNAQIAATFGVNVDPITGDLFGKAWGENIGWINFDTRATQGPSDQQARLDICENRFRGYVWGENVGWISLDDATHFLALGPNCTDGDVACDGVIALGDYAHFQQNLTGPSGGAACSLFDTDLDDDVDLFDAAGFLNAYTGE